MEILQFKDVFVPGGLPSHTYNPRVGLKLEENLSQVKHNFCKLVIVTGDTKSGKTVLVRKILPRDSEIWVDGGSIGTENDFWEIVINTLDLYQSYDTSDASEEVDTLEGEVGGGGSLGIIKGDAHFKGGQSSSKISQESKGRSISSRVIAIEGLRKLNKVLVIDDFHYLPKELQGDIVRALKALIFDGLGVVIIAIPHRRYDAVRVEREMTGRILSIEIPKWSPEELQYIPMTGFEILQREIEDNIVSRLVDESIGSPHLMQEFCRGICRAKSEDMFKLLDPLSISKGDINRVFIDTAETIGRPIFEKLARGPRARTDRIQRKLKDGREVDIYRLVLHALARIRPEMETLEYEDLRSAIRDVSAQEVPQLHEVSRVLRHMSAIAASDQSSTPVIDFDDDRKVLHITDPFFAFYLRWGKLED